MSPLSAMAVVAISTLALAAQANAAACSKVSPDNADPPANAVEFARWNATGARRWDCQNGSLVNPAQIEGQGNFTSFDGVWTGGFSYYSGVGRFDIVNNNNGGKYSYDLDNKPGVSPNENSLPNARWTVNWLGAGPPPGLNAGEQYQVRTFSNRSDTVPTECPSKESNIVEVPFQNTYVLYNCEDSADGGAPLSSSAMSRSIGAIATTIIAAAAAAAFLF